MIIKGLQLYPPVPGKESTGLAKLPWATYGSDRNAAAIDQRSPVKAARGCGLW